MRRKILIVICIILIFISIKLLFTIITNNAIINMYNKEQYSEDQAKALTIFNFSQRYIANYNYGNILYKNGKYQQAIEEYKKALKGRAPKNKECNIRINYALSICKTVEVDEKDQNSIKEAIKIYETAIEILTEKGCANKNDNHGHNKDAEQLKKDIQKEIDRLKKLQKTDDTTQENTEEKKEEKKTIEETQTIEGQIQNIKEKAIIKQRETEKRRETYNKDFQRKTKNW